MDKKATHIVCHPSLYLMVDGKLKQMEMDSPLTLSDEQAASLMKKGFVKPIKTKKPVSAGKKKAEKAGE